MERAGYWTAVVEEMFDEEGEPLVTDPLHVALATRYQVPHLGGSDGLLRDDLLEFRDLAASSAAAKLDQREA